MTRYLKLYWSLVKYNLTRDLQFRSDFWLGVFSRLIWFLLIIFFFQVIYLQTVQINGWSLNQTLLLVAIFELVETILYVFFISNFAQMPRYISDGDLDFLLLKPVDAQFLASLQYFSLASALNIIPPFVLFIYASRILSLSVSFIQILNFLIGITSSVLILYSLWFITVISLFWLAKIYAVHEFFLSIFRFMQYPSSIYQGLLRHIFTFVFPIILTITVPAQILLGTLTDPRKLFVLPVLALLTLVVARLVWKLGLRRYSSASS